jgi:hypothetical protein
VTLSAPGDWASYLWLPGGETTPEITVAPLETTTYAVIVTDSAGCSRRGSITVPGIVLQDSDCLAPAIGSLSPDSGPAAGGTPVTITGVNFQPGAEVSFGGVPAAAVTVVGPEQMTATAPSLAPGTLHDVLVTNPDSGNAALLKGWLADFLDVAGTNPFHDAITRLVRNRISAGCGGGDFCPTAPVTRAQSAVLLLKSKLGPDYQPPAPVGYLFGDVPASTFAAAWIEDLFNREITAGCQDGGFPLYCPNASLTRAQLAVLLLRTLLGSEYVPPAATGTVFEDVPAGAFAAAWIEDLYARGIAQGCSASPRRFCPATAATRGEMAVLLVRAFGLP